VPAGFDEGSNWWDWPDADSDGLPDKWESDGVWVKGQYLDLPGKGATPDHKDLFLRYDYEEGRPLSEDTTTYMHAMFREAPLSNPDGAKGVRLHIEMGTEIPSSIVGDYQLTKDDIIRVGTYSGYLSSPQYGGGGVPPLYKSMINLRQKPSGSTIGTAFVKGQFGWTGWDVDGAWAAFNINLPTWEADSRRLAKAFAQASNASHELGHLLGLQHHNDTATPERDGAYKSIMSYSYSNFGVPGDGFLPLHRIDYSRSDTPKKDWKMGEAIGSLTFISGQDGEIDDFYANTADDQLFAPGEPSTEPTEDELIESSSPESFLQFLTTYDAPAAPSVPSLADASASVVQGEVVSIPLDAQDPGGSPVSYLVDTEPLAGSVAAAAGGVTYAAGSAVPGVYSFSVRASNGVLSSVPATVVVTVLAAPEPPPTSIPTTTPTMAPAPTQESLPSPSTPVVTETPNDHVSLFGPRMKVKGRAVVGSRVRVVHFKTHWNGAAVRYRFGWSLNGVRLKAAGSQLRLTRAMSGKKLKVRIVGRTDGITSTKSFKIGRVR
jgi:hypothetical protein